MQDLKLLDLANRKGKAPGGYQSTLNEARLPFDFDAALKLAAPRPVLLIAPTLDRYARAADVEAAVRPVMYESLTLETPLDFNRFYRPTQQRMLDWLAERAR